MGRMPFHLQMPSKQLSMVQAEFNLMVRLSESDQHGWCRCATCGVRKHYKQMAAGHFLSKGAHPRLRFVRANVHCQCHQCNHYGVSLDAASYTIWMFDVYGRNAVDHLKRLSATWTPPYLRVKKRERSDMLDAMRQKYKRRAKALLQTKAKHSVEANKKV